MRPVTGTVTGDGQNGAIPVGLDLVCSTAYHSRGSGTGLAEHRCRDSRRPHKAGEPGSPIEGVFRGHGQAEKESIECTRRNRALLQSVAGYCGGKTDGMKVREIALPACERGRPVASIGDRDTRKLHRMLLFR